VTIVVHHLNESRSQRILWLLEELPAPYEVAFYQRDARSNPAPVELREIHPLRKSPVITEGDRVIAESEAIIDYIVRRHGDGLRNLPYCRSAIPGRHRNYTCRLLENFVPRCDQWLPLSQISSSNAQGNRFNRHQQEINDVQVLFTPY
jgi:glutathione S-transferase